MEIDFSVYDSLPCCATVFLIEDDMKIVYANKVHNKHFDSEYIPMEDEDKKIFLETVRKARSPKQLGVRVKNLDGETVFVNIVITKLSGTHALAIMVDDTESHEEIERLKEKSSIDPLSKVYNRETAIDLINERLENMEPYTECAFAVLDIDNFKRINDKFGHTYGDAVISTAAKYIKGALDEDTVIGRFGGDEFFFFIDKVNRGNLEIMAENIILEILRMRNDPDDEDDISCSIGIAIGHDGTSYGELFRQADSALYAAKQKGKNRYEYFSGEYFDEQAIDYTGADADEVPEVADETSDIVKEALDIASQSVSGENAITNIMRYVGTVLDLEYVQIMSFDTVEDKVGIEFQWKKESSGTCGAVSVEKKIGYYMHSDLMLFRDRLAKESIFRYTPDFKNGFSAKYYDVLAAAENNNMIFASADVGEKIFYVMCFHYGFGKRKRKSGEMEDMLKITKILSMFIKYSNTVSEREKQLEDSLGYTPDRLYTIIKFEEETGRISREARKNDERVAVIHFDFKYFYMFNRIHGKDEGDKVISLFSDFLLSGDKTKVVSAGIQGTDIFVSFVRYPRGMNICPTVEEKLNEFCKNAGEYDSYPPIIKAGVCSFESGEPVDKAIYIAKNAKRGLDPERCVCVEERNADFNF